MLIPGPTKAGDFYPRPPRGGRRDGGGGRHPQLHISTHALREEGDLNIFSVIDVFMISTHALREEGDPIFFQRCRQYEYFYPRPPRGGRLACADCGRVKTLISTHALREEGD